MSDRLSSALLQARALDAPFALTHGKPVSWGQFLARIRAWAAHLRTEPGQRWGLFCDDADEAAVRLFGAWAAGKTVVLPGDLLPATLQGLQGEVDGWLAGPPQAMVEPAPADFTLAALDDELPALIVFTSGTSGTPVAIEKRLRQLAAELTVIESLWGEAASGATILGTVSHQHLYGLLFRLLWPVCSGRSLLAQQLLYPETVAAALADGDAVLVSSPAFLRRWPEALALHALPPAPRIVFSSGGPLAREASLAVRAALGATVVEVYGSSESGGVAWRIQSDQAADAAWQPHVCVELDFAETGLRLRSPFMPDAAVWYDTADRAQAIDGGFRLLGRADRIVKVEEKRVSLDAVERALARQPEISDVRCCLLPEGRLGAVLVLSDAGKAAFADLGRAALHAKLRSAIVGDVEALALPRRWRHVDSMPLNALGKTPQALLCALFGASSEQPEAHVLSVSDTQAVIALEVVPSLAAFEGHFPDTPILPGVVQLDWAMRWAQDMFGIAAPFRGVDALKFQHVVRPGCHLQLSLEHLPAKSAVAFRVTDGERTCASGRLMFGAAR